MKAVILLGHGARNPEWARPLEQIRNTLSRLKPGLAVELAFLEFMTPALEEAVETLAGRGAAHITIVPIFLAQGRHLCGLPARLDALRSRHPGCTLRLAAAAGEAPEVIAAIAAYIATQAEPSGDT